MPQNPPPRRRDSQATRAALLKAAGELFAERGYDRTTVRDIAARAGANQALLFRYFGTKEDLFNAVVAHRGMDLLNAGPAEQLPHRILELFLADTPEGVDHPILAMLRSAVLGKESMALRKEMGRAYVRAIAELAEGPEAELRAELVLAWLVGIGFCRSVLGSDNLRAADAERVEAEVRRGISALLDLDAPVTPS
ncbi:TetR/AcrR family transcriptional regulator [Allokutzneria albata]|uniref:DNA-binding transcriptional regulator, AcrR family n=1 Tax=Allokutzneria albata TaxID=211114 RepID=A0A1H0C4V9_ALLAB|nr:TetR family transcriptional regulator [Allokutzneria albata]SDN52889.1 DNA-binding transcriptional regulator, AcrR family [Allokutzneria albata]